MKIWNISEDYCDGGIVHLLKVYMSTFYYAPKIEHSITIIDIKHFHHIKEFNGTGQSLPFLASLELTLHIPWAS